MNGTIKLDTATDIPGRTRNWATQGAVAAGRGMVLFGFTLASLVLWAVLLTAVALIPLGVGLPLTAVALRAMRGLEARAWSARSRLVRVRRSGSPPRETRPPGGTGAEFLGPVRFPDGRPGHLAEPAVEHR